VPKVPLLLIKGRKMSNTTETDLPIETPNSVPSDTESVCQLGDKECVKRLIQAMSDCD
jgi:hypothetical protein